MKNPAVDYDKTHFVRIYWKILIDFTCCYVFCVLFYLLYEKEGEGIIGDQFRHDTADVILQSSF